MSRKILALPLALLGIGGLALVFSESVFQSKHNLSFSGLGPVTAATEAEVCIFCHAPHNAGAEAPLWNRFSSGAVYQPYTSSSAVAVVGQPSGASKLCLSCHDGTVALDSFGGATGTTFLTGPTLLGTDLSNDHPVSFIFDSALAAADGGLENPATAPSGLLGTIREDLLFNDRMECASCHDVHNSYNQAGLLVKSNAASALCATCHTK